MAARINGMHTEQVRARIKLGLLQKRLEDNSLGKIEMTDGQIKTATFLVNKAMSNPPETSNLNHSGNVSLNWPLSKTKLDQ